MAVAKGASLTTASWTSKIGRMDSASEAKRCKYSSSQGEESLRFQLLLAEDQLLHRQASEEAGI